MGFRGVIDVKKPSYIKYTELFSIKKIPDVYLPIGEEYTPTLNEGDPVLVGQLVAVALGHKTPIHSSVSGVIDKIIKTEQGDMLRIINDGKYTVSDQIKPCEKKLSQMSCEEMIERIRLCGISQWEQLSYKRGKALRFALVCQDRDPYSSSIKCEISNHPVEIINGAKILLKILGLNVCEIIISKNATSEMNTLLDCIGSSTLFDITEIPQKYISDNISSVLEYMPPKDENEPDENNTFIIDAHTASAVYRAFSEGMPYIRRTVSIGGSASYEEGCFDIPYGTPIKYITDQVMRDDDGVMGQFTAVIGGPLRGKELSASEYSVVTSTDSITYIRPEELKRTVSACIGCTKCDKVCPEYLLPSVFIQKYEKNDEEALTVSGMNYCTSCGACSFICPSNIPICEIAKGDTSPLSPDNLQKKQTVRSAPFIHSQESVVSHNIDMLIPLIALLIWSVCLYGIKALLISTVSVLTAVMCDLVFSALTKTSPKTPLTLDSFVVGLLTALTLTHKTPLYVAAIAAFIAIIFIKGAFGGTGKNIIHSAFASRVIVSLLFHDAFIYDTAKTYTLFDHIIGNTEGAFGEVSVLILAASLIYLVFSKAISISVPLSIISSFSIVTFFIAPSDNQLDFTKLSIIGTAIIFVAVFIQTEHSTVPKNIIGRIIYGVLCGTIAAMISRYTSYEGGYLAAIIASLITPMLNRISQVEQYETPSMDGTVEEYFGDVVRDAAEGEYDNTSSDADKDIEYQNDTANMTVIHDATAQTEDEIVSNDQTVNLDANLILDDLYEKLEELKTEKIQASEEQGVIEDIDNEALREILLKSNNEAQAPAPKHKKAKRKV